MLIKKICKSSFLFIVIIAAVILVGCSNSKKTKYTVNDIKCGTFYSTVQGSDERIEILPDSKIQFVGFDVEKMANLYGDILEEVSLSYEAFEEIFTHECPYHTYFDENDSRIHIVAHIFGEDCGIGLDYCYYFDNDTIVFDDKEYKYSAENIMEE